MYPIFLLYNFSILFTVFLATDVSTNKQKLHSSIQIDIGELAMKSSNTVSYFVFSLIEATITLQQKIIYTTDVLKPKLSTAIIQNDVTTPSSTDVSPEGTPSSTKTVTANSSVPATLTMPLAMPLITPVQLEFIDENSLRKTQDTSLSVKCEPEFKFQGRFYTLNRKPLTKIYRGENFLFRAGVEVQTDVQLEILETYFICVGIKYILSTFFFSIKLFKFLHCRIIT